MIRIIIKDFLPEIVTLAFLLFIIFTIDNSSYNHKKYMEQREMEREKMKQKIEDDIYNFLTE